MLQVIRIMISVKKGTPRSRLILLNIWKADLVEGYVIPIEAQHALAKLYLSKRRAKLHLKDVHTF
jgi:hypothetical protein